jgi:hypothetical protein
MVGVTRKRITEYNLRVEWLNSGRKAEHMIPFAQSEIESIKKDAVSSEGKTPGERMAMFADLLQTVSAVWQHLSPEERRRRMRIADQLNRRPEPWWKNFRAEALSEYRCNSSSR